jgi:hypothetical protein
MVPAVDSVIPVRFPFRSVFRSVTSFRHERINDGSSDVAHTCFSRSTARQAATPAERARRVRALPAGAARRARVTGDG